MRSGTWKLTAVAALATGAGALALSSGAGAQAGARDIVLREKGVKLHLVRQSSKLRANDVAVGDRVVTTQELYDAADTRVGRLFIDCVNVGAKGSVLTAQLHCTGTYRVADGSVTAAGLAVFTDPHLELAIVGGTGAYRGARGYVTSGAPPAGYDAADVLHLTG